MRFYFSIIVLFFLVSCVKNKNNPALQQNENAKAFEVAEVIQGSTYTYLKVKEKGNEKWIAVTRQDAVAGDVFYYDQELQMNNFHSKEIDRTFEIIYFVNNISKTPLGTENEGTMGAMGGMGGMMGGGQHSGKVNATQNSAIHLEKKDGELTIATVFANRNEYASKEFEIRGVVVKVNEQVMDKNWVHIQDGTADNGNFDLTLTTSELPAVNDEITVKGKLTLNKDYGYGYSYEVIMEDATVKVDKKAGASM
jgi:hypothetical protein